MACKLQCIIILSNFRKLDERITVNLQEAVILVLLPVSMIHLQIFYFGVKLK